MIDSTAKANNCNLHKQAYLSKTVYFDPFLDTKCSYLEGSDLDDSYLSKGKSEIDIFHNNMRSLNNAKFGRVSR